MSRASWSHALRLLNSTFYRFHTPFILYMFSFPPSPIFTVWFSQHLQSPFGSSSLRALLELLRDYFTIFKELPPLLVYSDEKLEFSFHWKIYSFCFFITSISRSSSALKHFIFSVFNFLLAKFLKNIVCKIYIYIYICIYINIFLVITVHVQQNINCGNFPESTSKLFC